MTQTARSAAIAKQDQAIAENVAAIQKPKGALEMMASRLNIGGQQLKNTLLSTVFKGAKDEEFIALVVVANEYGLNPLTKEIYAFPSKGGGITPMVSIDGWIRIMNQHPQYDGIEFEDLPDSKGNIMACKAVIYRKDRTRPTSIIEYLEECKRNTEPWNKSPARMLRHRALMQCARYAFGFSGISVDDGEGFDEIVIVAEAKPQPTRKEIAAPKGGERTVEDEETARRLDAEANGEKFDAETGEVIQEQTDDAPAWKAKADEWTGRANAAEHMAEINAVQKQYDLSRAVLPDDVVEALDGVIEQARDRVKGGAA